MMTTGRWAGQVAEVRGCLARVTDPELDEPVTELGFVTDVDIDPDGAVAIGFRLPTYWCAPNFAFMMGSDMRREVATLRWVTQVRVTLHEHMYAEKINTGLAQGLSFQDTFGAEATGELHALRHTFLVKAFQRRQEALLRHLLATGHTAGALVALTLAELDALPLEEEGERLRVRYEERRDAVDGDAVGRVRAQQLAFVDIDGGALIAADLSVYLQTLQRVGINAEFNGALCRGLLEARFGKDVPQPRAEPSLLDFARMPPVASRVDR